MIDWGSKTRKLLERVGGARLKKLGLYGFLFFFIKGLLWLIIPALMLYFGFGTD